MLGARIATLRRSSGMSQQQLAALLGCSASAVGMYEQGRREPSGRLLVEMAQAFGVSTDYLLTGCAHSNSDTRRLRRILQQASADLGGELLLRGADGTARAVTEHDIAVLMAALLG